MANNNPKKPAGATASPPPAIPFFNLVNLPTEHCFAWLIGSGVIDPVVLIEQCRQQAAEEFDVLPADDKADLDRDKLIEEDMLEKLIEAIEELFNDQFDEVLPGSWDVVGLGDTCQNDPEILVKGLAACGWDKVPLKTLAKALMLYVKTSTTGDGEQPLPNGEKESP